VSKNHLKNLFFILSLFFFATNFAFAQPNSANYNAPQGALKTFLERSNLAYFEEVHGDLLSNTDITMPVFEGCAADCKTPTDCQCSQWQASRFITDRLVYPENGYKAGWVGDFRIEYTVDENGKTKDVEVTCDAPDLAKQIEAIVLKMPVWKPAKAENAVTALRIYSSFGFYLEKEQVEKSNTAYLHWGNTNLVLQPNTNTLTISEAELSVIKNEPILFMIGDDELAVQSGNVVFTTENPKKEYKMDAAETLDSDRTDKIAAFIDAFVVQNSEISFAKLKAFNPNTGVTMDLPDLVVKIK
jgi:Gram-negative bacterial TonB protein C-terminal